MLLVNEIFESISGEAGGFPQGSWCTFIRLQGCNLGCSWCDTQRARPPIKINGAEECSLISIISRVRELGNKKVLITGGEPLSQLETIELIEGLLDRDYEVQVETNGSYLIPFIPSVHWVIDYKCFSSGMTEKMLPISVLSCNLRTLRQAYSKRGGIYIKYVVADDADLFLAMQVIEELSVNGIQAKQIISPVNAEGKRIKDIVKKLKEDIPEHLDQIVFSVQLHKICDLA